MSGWLRRLEVAQIERLGTSALGLLARTDVLVLTTRGRRTGALRATPLAYQHELDGWMVCGGAGGARSVDWLANLGADPHGVVTVDRRAHRVVALRPTGARYEERSGRTVPIVVLRPAPTPDVTLST